VAHGSINMPLALIEGQTAVARQKDIDTKISHFHKTGDVGL
jgi:hypothetical protein